MSVLVRSERPTLEPLQQESEPTILESLRHLWQVIGKVRSACPDEILLCIPWMQIKHPLHPQQLAWLQQPPLKPVGPSFIRGFFQSGLAALYWALRILQARFVWRRALGQLKGQRFDGMVKSWGLEKAPTDSGSSFYLGDLQRRLKRKGVQLLILSGDPYGRNWRRKSLDPTLDKDAGWLCEWCLIPWFAPFSIAFQQIRAGIRLRRLVRTARDPWVQRVADQASRDIFSKGIFPIGSYSWIGKEAIRRWRPKTFLTLYEGHGWEQILLKSVKAADPTCRTIGYLHTILKRHNLALLESSGAEQVRPDAVLCLGTRSCQMLSRSHDRNALIPFGTFRREARVQGTELPVPSRKTVLVLPEGHPDEMIELFDLAGQVARRLPDHHFILRCHPAAPYPFEQIHQELFNQLKRNPNVSISNSGSVGVEEEFRRSSVLLYRGSSGVLYAILSGLKPIYMEHNSGIDLDPLYELSSWRERVASVDALEAALREYAQAPETTLQEWEKAKVYVHSSCQPVDETSVEKLLQALQTGGEAA